MDEYSQADADEEFRVESEGKVRKQRGSKGNVREQSRRRRERKKAAYNAYMAAYMRERRRQERLATAPY